MQELVEKVNVLMADSDTLKAISLRARKDVIERFSEGRMVKEIMDFIRSC